MQGAGMDLDQLRMLDVDDLIIMSISLEEGVATGKIAKHLLLTPPAVSHRLNKYASIFGEDIYASPKVLKAKRPSRRILSEKGRRIFATCASALRILKR
jgi:hypothetical protein